MPLEWDQEAERTDHADEGQVGGVGQVSEARVLVVDALPSASERGVAGWVGKDGSSNRRRWDVGVDVAVAQTLWSMTAHIGLDSPGQREGDEQGASGILSTLPFDQTFMEVSSVPQASSPRSCLLEGGPSTLVLGDTEFRSICSESPILTDLLYARRQCERGTPS